MSTVPQWVSLVLLCACNANPTVADGDAQPPDDGVDSANPDDDHDWAYEANWSDKVPEFSDDPDDDDPDGLDLPFDPWALNVVLYGNLGSEQEPYQSDFQGAAAVAGDVWITNFA